MTSSVLLIIFVLSAVVSFLTLLLGIYARNAQKSLYFSIMTLSIFIFNIGFLFEVTASSFQTAFIAAQVQYFGGPFISTLFFLFVCEYCGYKLKIYQVLLSLVMPVTVCLMVLTWPLNGYYYKSAVLVTDLAIPQLKLEVSAFYYVYIAYSLIASVAADIILIHFFRRRDNIFRKQALIFIIATSLPIVGTALNSFGIIDFGFDPVPICLSGTCLLFAYSFLRLGLYRVSPIARERILETMSDGFIVMDTYGRFIDANIAAKNIFPQLETASVGMMLSEIDEVAWLSESTDSLRKEYSFQDQNGTYMRYRISETEVKDANKVIGRCIVLFEVTLEEALKEASAASKAKSDFLARMSHEIRTPMNAVIGMAELALRESESEAIRGHVFTIKQAGSNLLSIVNDILDFSKIEAGKLEINSNYYQFSSLMNDVISIIRMRAVDSDLCFVVNIDSNIPNELYGDEARIRQVLINVLGNAVKYTEKGFVSFTVLGTFTDESTICLNIDVMDSGRGIKEEDINKLFQDFTQVDVPRSKGVEGTGLGLAIAWNIIKAMGGEISVVSEYGNGSTFSVTLPQQFRSNKKLAYVDRPEEKSVLVYERSDLHANSMVCTIDNLGVACTLASDDDEFYELLEANSYPFIFISTEKFEQNRGTIAELGKNAKTVLLAEFGDVVANTGLSILSMPIQSISVANILNGESETYLYHEEAESYATFIAPDARILVVDDIRTNLKVTEGLLAPYRVKVDLCSSGGDAIEAVQRKHYDLVFMDHKMPEMDGVEATLRIRAMGEKDEYYKNLPIIALTANAVSGVQEMFIVNGFNGFLSKPSDNVRLNTTLEKWLPREKQRSASFLSGVSDDQIGRDAPAVGVEIDGVDIKKGIAMTGGSWERYLETLAVFHEDATGRLKELRIIPEKDNLPLYTIYIHAMKSAASHIGAAELSNAASELEMACRRMDLEYIKTNIPAFLSTLESILNGINDVISANSGNGRATDGGETAEVLRYNLSSLKKALTVLDAGIMNSVLDDLLKLNVSEDVGVVIRSISRSILMVEYDEAIELIETLLREEKE